MKLTKIGTILVTSALLTGLGVSTAAAAENEPLPAELGAAPTVAATSATTITLATLGNGNVSGTVKDISNTGVPDATVTITVTGTKNFVTTTQTNINGVYTKALNLPGGTYVITSSIDAISSTPANLTVNSHLTINATSPTVKSETPTGLTVSVKDYDDAVNAVVTVTSIEPTQPGKTVGTTNIGDDGTHIFGVTPWRNPTYVVTATYNGANATISVIGKTVASKPVTTLPAGSPRPADQDPVTAPPIGNGSNTVVRKIDNDLWNRMKGVSWNNACVGRNGLRVVETNYITFDGYRMRGPIVVNKKIANKIKTVFTRFYDKNYPIRQMRTVEYYGKNVGGRPGANDYKSMAADNTSGFNCRFVVGKESSKTRSPHASGRSLDINTWENPYVSPTGVYPNSYFLNRNIKTRATFKKRNVGYKIMKQAGCSWGGGYRDYHHWDC